MADGVHWEIMNSEKKAFQFGAHAELKLMAVSGDGTE